MNKGEEWNGLTYEQFIGEQSIEGDLELSEDVPEGFAARIQGNLIIKARVIGKGFKPHVEGFLQASACREISEGFSPFVHGGLNLEHLEVVASGFNPIANSIALHRVTTLPRDFRPIAGWFMYMGSVEELPDDYGFSPTCGHSLLMGLKHIPKGFNPRVGRSLILLSAESMADDFSPIVPEEIRLGTVKYIPEGFDPVTRRLVFAPGSVIPEGRSFRADEVRVFEEDKED